jgi:hypothetical protein
MPANEGWIAQRLADMQRQITELRAAQTLGAATVGSGGITIQGGALTLKDATGSTTLARLDATGLSVLPYGGTQLQKVGGTLSTPALSAIGVNTSGAFVNFAGSPTITAVIGPSGSVLIGGSFEIDTNTAGIQGGVNVAIDGGVADVEIAKFFIVSGRGALVGGSTFRWDGLTPGTHTFTAQYSTLNAGSVDFNGNMYVQPL